MEDEFDLCATICRVKVRQWQIDKILEVRGQDGVILGVKAVLAYVILVLHPGRHVLLPSETSSIKYR